MSLSHHFVIALHSIDKYITNVSVGGLFFQSLTVKCLYSTWSDRELRTVLSRLYDLPLQRSSVLSLETALLFCARNFHYQQSISTPPYERYIDSRLVRRHQKIKENQVTRLFGNSQLMFVLSHAVWSDSLPISNVSFYYFNTFKQFKATRSVVLVGLRFSSA